jgi:hypothetical protein
MCKYLKLTESKIFVELTILECTSEILDIFRSKEDSRDKSNNQDDDSDDDDGDNVNADILCHFFEEPV